MKSTTLEICAINPKYQRNVTRYFNFDRQYNELVNQELDETPKGEKLFERCLDIWSELPKREQANISKVYSHLFGYTPIASPI